jgi:asparagine synthase (glutamine-hydrolysing)
VGNKSTGWDDFEYFEPYWEERTQRMAEYIRPNQSVVDIGCGEMKLRKYLPANCYYVGLDFQKRDEETVVCNFNNEPLPKIVSNVYFISGALEYAYDPEDLIKQISRSTNDTIIFSYCLLEDFPQNIRDGLNWVNSLTEEDIHRILKKNGFTAKNTFKVLGNTVFIAKPRFSFKSIIQFFSITHNRSSKNIHIMKSISSSSNVHTKISSNKIYFDQDIRTLIEKVNSSWSYLGIDALYDLANTMNFIEDSGLEGDIIETGCALGGSAIVIASVKSSRRLFKVYDVFGMIPAPSNEDGSYAKDRYAIIKSGQSDGLNGEKYYGYEEDLLQKVKNNFAEVGYNIEKNNIKLIKGLYEETLRVNSPVAFVHIDCDWYDSVKFCLTMIVPHLVVGGVLVIDDYHYYDGCKKAVDEYFASQQDKFSFVNRSRLHIVRIL